MIELTTISGNRVAVVASEVALVLENAHGCRVILKNGSAIDVNDAYDKIGAAEGWRLQ